MSTPCKTEIDSSFLRSMESRSGATELETTSGSGRQMACSNTLAESTTKLRFVAIGLS